MFGKDLFIRITVHVFYVCVCVHVCVCVSFPFGFEGGMWKLIVLVPHHCLTIHFRYMEAKENGSEQQLK